jgi:hypothetical protein
MDENETQEVGTEDVEFEDGTENPTEETKETPKERPKETPEQKKARLERQLKKVRKELGEEVDEPKVLETKPDGLDETQLDYLDLKGITDDNDIAVIESVMKRTGMTVREALKDEYVMQKLEASKKQREVKSATPSSTKRSGGQQSSDLDLAVAKYESSGYNPETLPNDFALRSQVINAIAMKESPNKPSWQ